MVGATFSRISSSLQHLRQEVGNRCLEHFGTFVVDWLVLYKSVYRAKLVLSPVLCMYCCVCPCYH